jgi:hypothetical protein
MQGNDLYDGLPKAIRVVLLIINACWAKLRSQTLRDPSVQDSHDHNELRSLSSLPLGDRLKFSRWLRFGASGVSTVFQAKPLAIMNSHC